MSDTKYIGVEAIKEMFRVSSSDELKRIINSSDLKPDDNLHYQGPVYGHLLTFILLAGSSFRASLKIFYGASEARKFTSAKFKKSEAQISDVLVADFMKEFANLVAGSVKRTLGTLDVSVGLGLPLTTRGFDDVFAADGLSEGIYTDKWALKSDLGKVICMTSIKILEDANVAKINWDPTPKAATADDSDMEFL